MTELELNKKITKLYRDLVKLEEKSIKNDKGHMKLTVNELHLIECIRCSTKNQEGPTISTIAYKLGITRPSTTVAVNKLCAKKYVTKTECVNDGRSVRVKLTSKGEKAYTMHKNYSTGMLKEFVATLSGEAPDDFDTIAKSVGRLSDFVDAKLKKITSEEDEF